MAKEPKARISAPLPDNLVYPGAQSLSEPQRVVKEADMGETSVKMVVINQESQFSGDPVDFKGMHQNEHGQNDKELIGEPDFEPPRSKLMLD